MICKGKWDKWSSHIILCCAENWPGINDITQACLNITKFEILKFNHTTTTTTTTNNNGPAVRVFANGPGDLGSIPGRVIPKDFKNGTWYHLA